MYVCVCVEEKSTKIVNKNDIKNKTTKKNWNRANRTKNHCEFLTAKRKKHEMPRTEREKKWLKIHLFHERNEDWIHLNAQKDNEIVSNISFFSVFFFSAHSSKQK